MKIIVKIKKEEDGHRGVNDLKSIKPQVHSAL